MIKEKLKPVFLYCLLSAFVFISILYFGYYMYYEGYIASEIDTCDTDTIKTAVEHVLLSENTQEKKKELIEKLCSYTYAEISVENLSNRTMFYKKESEFTNKKLFKCFGLSAQTIKIKDEYYSIKYKTCIPKFYTTMKYCLYLGKNMTRI